MLDEKQFYKALDKAYKDASDLFDATLEQDVHEAGKYLGEAKGIKNALSLFFKMGGRIHDK